ncbi:MAG: hypothetical protein C4292_06765 [Nitrososphaera sp.]
MAFTVRKRLKGVRATAAAASILGIAAGIGGASHGPGEMLQGNVAPAGLVIEAWPALTLLSGEPAMTLVPSTSFLVTVVLALVSGGLVAFWPAMCLWRKNGGLVLILLSVAMLFVGGGIIPPVIGVAAGIMATRLGHRDAARLQQQKRPGAQTGW